MISRETARGSGTPRVRVVKARPPDTRNDKRRQHVDGHENADDVTELATSLGDE